jgi:hypothetical protein
MHAYRGRVIQAGKICAKRHINYKRLTWKYLNVFHAVNLSAIGRAM